ncbi:hypothetical protein ACI3DN_11935 [Sellimonas catena]|uniref:Uncharacterized protein n=1 Tax=Sellimonas catena TaxID=2994035 RepID=A0A9W6CC31_9FIRM|nr:hypothetical protein [Sellimonas catena]GLG04166.1 hypothetical protein Selli1_13400 [Sellimonas catena]GLG89050.1 hypothetical protein Selli2_04760 [Sellimonas catena]
MKTAGKILKKCWLKMVIVFVLVTAVAFGVMRFAQNNDVKEQRENLTVGAVLKFDITTYTYLGDGTASVYDYVSVWQNEDLLSDCVELLDQGDAIRTLDPEWDDKNAKSKKEWINENIRLQRLATSTMYNITYNTEVTEDSVESQKEAAREVINSYVEYAGSIAALSDENIKYDVAKEIMNEEPIFTQGEEKVNTILELGVGAVLGILVSATYFGIKVIRSDKKAR